MGIGTRRNAGILLAITQRRGRISRTYLEGRNTDTQAEEEEEEQEEEVEEEGGVGREEGATPPPGGHGVTNTRYNTVISGDETYFQFNTIAQNQLPRAPHNIRAKFPGQKCSLARHLSAKLVSHPPL